MNPERTRGRSSNIELLRILLMLGIVLHHGIILGGNLLHPMSLPQNHCSYQKLVLESFLLFPVDCFVFVSGFFRISFRVDKVLTLWLQSFFYSVAIMIVFKVLSLDQLTTRDIVFPFFPITFGKWWFITCYFFLLLLSPILNHICDTLPKPTMEYLLIIGFVVNSVISFLTGSVNLGGTGSTLMNFMFIYILGRYFGTHVPTLNTSRARLLLFYVISSAMLSCATVLLFTHSHGDRILILYRLNNPIILCQAICIFYVFRALTFTSSIINYCSSSVLAVYLIHEHPLVRRNIYKHFSLFTDSSDRLTYVPSLLLFAVLVLLSCIAIDILRRYSFTPISKYLATAQWTKALESKILGQQSTASSERG